MAPKLLILALLFMAVVASTYSAAPAKAPEAPSDDEIGEVGGDDSGDGGLAPSSEVVEAPVGGPVTEGAFSNLGPSAATGGDKKNGAAELEVSAVPAGAAAVAAGFFFLKF